jgi:hypothetical protein
MAGEAVSGRYGAARHAVADGGGPRHPASDDRSLVDRLLAGDGEEHAFDWDWGDSATGDLVSDREPLHDIPELWGTDERPARGSGEAECAEEKPFPTPRAHDENSLDERLDPDGPGSRADDGDWSDRSPADRGSDDRGSDDWGSLGSEDREHGAGDRRSDGGALGGDPLDRDPLDALSTGRVHAENGPLGDSARDRDMPDRGQQHDVPMDGDHVGSRAGADSLERSPLAPPLPKRDPLDGERLSFEPFGREPGADLDRDSRDHEQAYRGLFDSGPLNRDPLGQDPLNPDSSDRGWPERDQRPPGGASAGDSADHLSPYRDQFERPRTDDDRFAGGPSHDLDRFERDHEERGSADRDAISPEPLDRKLVDVDPRLRRWADRDRPSGPSRADRPATPTPSADGNTASDPLRSDALAAGREDRAGDALGTDRLGPDPFGSDQFGADLRGAGPDERDRSDVGPAQRDADPFAESDSAESVLTGRIRVTDADGPGPDRPRQEPAGGEPAGRDVLGHAPSPVPGPLDVTPDPTTALTVVAPPAPARRSAPEEHALPLEEYAARRRAAEQAAASAEEAASLAAERASAAIAAAAAAAEEAEAAAEAAAKAAEQANEAADVEVRAIADAVARGDAPGQQDARADAPEPPTQAVPLIAPARAPGRRPPPRRPAGPPPRASRLDEPGRPSGPPPRAAHQNGPARGGSDGEATAVLTGLDALRDPVRPRRKEPASAEATAVTRRRPAAEPLRVADDVDDVDDVDDAEPDNEPEERGLVGRLTSRPVIAAVGVGAVLVIAAIVAIFTTSEPEAAPAEATPAALSAPVAQQAEPTAAAVDLQSKKAVAFLTALRDADIPTSSSGQAEVEAADAICSQLDQGADEAQLARSVPAVLPNVTRGQASDVVDFAQQFYC